MFGWELQLVEAYDALVGSDAASFQSDDTRRSGLSAGSGSVSNTSRAAPLKRLVRNASISAVSSNTGPRD